MIVYKYFTTESAIRSILNSRIVFSEPSEYNDPFDGRSIPLSKIMNSDASESEFTKQIEEYYKTHISTCFSVNWDNVLMWAHYGDNCKGICIGFDSELMFTNCDYKYVHSFEPVSYQTYMKPINDHEEYEKVIQKIEQDLIRKNTAWSYEEEIRTVIHKEPHFHKIKEKQSYLVPFSVLSIKEVIFGTKCPAMLIAPAIRLCQRIPPKTHSQGDPIDNGISYAYCDSDNATRKFSKYVFGKDDDYNIDNFVSQSELKYINKKDPNESEWLGRVFTILSQPKPSRMG